MPKFNLLTRLTTMWSAELFCGVSHTARSRHRLVCDRRFTAKHSSTASVWRRYTTDLVARTQWPRCSAFGRSSQRRFAGASADDNDDDDDLGIPMSLGEWGGALERTKVEDERRARDLRAERDAVLQRAEERGALCTLFPAVHRLLLTNARRKKQAARMPLPLGGGLDAEGLIAALPPTKPSPLGGGPDAEETLAAA